MGMEEDNSDQIADNGMRVSFVEHFTMRFEWGEERGKKDNAEAPFA